MDYETISDRELTRRIANGEWLSVRKVAEDSWRVYPRPPDKPPISRDPPNGRHSVRVA